MPHVNLTLASCRTDPCVKMRVSVLDRRRVIISPFKVFSKMAITVAGNRNTTG